MIEIKRKAYSIGLHPMSGTVKTLKVPGDPEGINLAHVGHGFGALVFTRRDEESISLKPSNFVEAGGPPGNVVHFNEHLAHAQVVKIAEGQVVCRNPTTRHTLTYEFFDDYFDLWIEGEMPYANQLALQIEPAFMDLRQSDPPERQYTVKCPYRSEDRSLCYVYCDRVIPPGLLVTALTPMAAWRLIYHGNEEINFGSSWSVQAMQMIHRFDSALDPDAPSGKPFKFGVRIAFPPCVDAARSFIVNEMKIPIVHSPAPGGQIGRRAPFKISGPAVGAELISPSGQKTPVPLNFNKQGEATGAVETSEQGFYLLRAWNSDRRGGDCVFHAGMDDLETLRRSVAAIRPALTLGEHSPCWCLAEYQYWIQSFCMARRFFGADDRRDAYLYEALVKIGMQGVDYKGPLSKPAKPPPLAIERLRNENGYLCAPTPQPHEYLGKRFSPFHLNCWERVQDAFEWVRSYLFAAEALQCDEFYEHAVRIAEAHIADNVDPEGRVYRLGHMGTSIHDYTTVIAPLQSLIELLIAMRERNDSRARPIEATCRKIADYLTNRGMEFPTEGCPSHMRWTEDGSISCTALSLLFAYHYLGKDPRYLDMAEKMLVYHEAWRMDAPDARMLDSSWRYWETMWENDGEGRAINAGHAWTLWQAEALYYHALAVGNPVSALRSYNGYRTNRCKFMENGVSYACFTPDYIPDRLRRKEPMHGYPRTPDISLSHYLWPRSEKTWMRTAALIDPADIGMPEELGLIPLNGKIVADGDQTTFLPSPPFFDRFFVSPGAARRLIVKSAKSVEIVHLQKPAAAGPANPGVSFRTPKILTIASKNGCVSIPQPSDL